MQRRGHLRAPCGCKYAGCRKLALWRRWPVMRTLASRARTVRESLLLDGRRPVCEHQSRWYVERRGPHMKLQGAAPSEASPSAEE